MDIINILCNMLENDVRKEKVELGKGNWKYGNWKEASCNFK